MTPRHAADHPAPARPAEGIRPAVAWGGLLVAGPSFWALAYFQHKLLGAAFPFAPWQLTAALAVGIDSFGVLAGAYWLRSPRETELRRWGFLFAVLAVLGSTGLMVWSINRLAPGYELLGLIPALIVFGTTKMFTVWQADRAAARTVAYDHAAELAAAEQRAVDAEQAVEQRVAELVAQLDDVRAQLAARPAVPASPEVLAQDDAPTGPVPAVPASPAGLSVVGSDRSGGKPTNDDIVAGLRRWAADDDAPELTRNAVMREYGIGTNRATRLLAIVQDQDAETAATGT